MTDHPLVLAAYDLATFYGMDHQGSPCGIAFDMKRSTPTKAKCAVHARCSIVKRINAVLEAFALEVKGADR